MGLNYREAGVDIDAGEKAVEKMSKYVKSTFNNNVLTDVGTFGAIYKPELKDYEEPVLVSGTDGVGTKLKVAFMIGKHDTVGIDLVAMSVNDILTQGARPLFFLDYLATGKLLPDRVAEIVKGIAGGCKRAGCALIGGETAEMAGFYKNGEYDLAGFAVGLVDKKNILTGDNIKPGDLIVGLESDGLHSNGFSLVRKVFFEKEKYSVQERIEGLDTNLGEELLKPTRIYVKPVLDLLKTYQGKQVKGIAHITGGGLVDNIPRILPENTTAVIEKKSWYIPAIFHILQEKGNIEEKEMFRTFNMGIGLVLIVKKDFAGEIVDYLQDKGEKAGIIGKIISGQPAVNFK